jgi:hypothetical protein
MNTTVTSLDGFHTTPTAQRADELPRDEQRHFVFGERPVPTLRPGQFCAQRWIVGPEGETPAALTIAPTPVRPSQD